MHDALTIYFDSEKYAGLLLAAIGVGIVAAAVLIFRTSPDLRAFAVTLMVIAFAEVALGVGLYFRTGPQVSRLVGLLHTDASRFDTEESPRMTQYSETS